MSIFSTLFNAAWIKLRGIGSKVIWNDEEGAIILPPNRCKQLAYGAPMFVLNYEYMDTIETGTPTETCSEVLSLYWEITDRESAIETMDWIFNEGHRTLTDQILKVIHTAPPEQHEDILIEMAEAQDEDPDEWLYKYETIQECTDFMNKNKLTCGKAIPKTIAAWDYVRAVAVARWCHECGYLDEKEMWSYIEESERLAKNDFFSWEEYGLSFIFGRGTWSGDKDKFSEACKLIKVLLTQKKSPWLDSWG